MPRPKGLRHKWLGGTRSSCQRPGCTWSRHRGYVPARYFQTDPKHPSYFGGGTPEAPVCEGQAFDLTSSQRFALGQIARHGTAHSARSTTALAARGLVAPKPDTIGEWQLTDAGKKFALEVDGG